VFFLLRRVGREQHLPSRNHSDDYERTWERGRVWYNYTTNEYFTSSANYSIPARGDHAADSDMILSEGNVSNGVTADVIHGSGNMELTSVITIPSSLLLAERSNLRDVGVRSLHQWHHDDADLCLPSFP